MESRKYEAGGIWEVTQSYQGSQLFKYIKYTFATSKFESVFQVNRREADIGNLFKCLGAADGRFKIRDGLCNSPKIPDYCVII